MSVPKQRLLGR